MAAIVQENQWEAVKPKKKKEAPRRPNAQRPARQNRRNSKDRPVDKKAAQPVAKKTSVATAEPKKINVTATKTTSWAKGGLSFAEMARKRAEKEPEAVVEAPKEPAAVESIPQVEMEQETGEVEAADEEFVVVDAVEQQEEVAPEPVQKVSVPVADLEQILTQQAEAEAQRAEAARPKKKLLLPFKAEQASTSVSFGPEVFSLEGPVRAAVEDLLRAERLEIAPQGTLNVNQELEKRISKLYAEYEEKDRKINQLQEQKRELETRVKSQAAKMSELEQKLVKQRTQQKAQESREESRDPEGPPGLQRPPSGYLQTGAPAAGPPNGMGQNMMHPQMYPPYYQQAPQMPNYHPQSNPGYFPAFSPRYQAQNQPPAASAGSGSANYEGNFYEDKRSSGSQSRRNDERGYPQGGYPPQQPPYFVGNPQQQGHMYPQGGSGGRQPSNYGWGN